MSLTRFHLLQAKPAFLLYFFKIVTTIAVERES